LDNQNSKPSIVPPALPVNFEQMAGTSKSDFARAILELMKSATIDGIQSDSPTPYDLSALQQSVQNLEGDVDKLKLRTPRRITVPASGNALIVVPFQDVGTDDYQVDAAWVTPNAPLSGTKWSIVAGSKKSNQVSLRVHGIDADTYTLEVTITPMIGI
jgi:hypothetical protein